MGNDSKFSAKDVEMLEFRQKLFREEVDKYVSSITGELTQTFQDLVRFSKEHYEELRELFSGEAGGSGRRDSGYKGRISEKEERVGEIKSGAVSGDSGEVALAISPET